MFSKIFGQIVCEGRRAVIGGRLGRLVVVISGPLPLVAADQRQLLGTGQVAKSRQVAGNVADWDPSSGLQTPGDQRR